MKLVANKQEARQSTVKTDDNTGREKRAQPSHPGLQPLAIPAAMNRLAIANGLGVSASDDALVNDFGNQPKRESIAILAEELGADFKPLRTDIKKLTIDDFPLIAITPSGGAIVMHLLFEDKNRILIEDAAGKRDSSISSLEPNMAGIFLKFSFTKASASRLSQSDASSSSSQTETTPARDMFATGILTGLVRLVLRQHKWQFGQLLTASLIINMFMIALPLYIMSVYDRVIPHTAFESLIALTVGIGIIFTADLGLRWTRLKFSDSIGLQISRTLQVSLYRRLLFMPITQRPQSSTAITNIQSELDTLCLITPEFMVSVIADTFLALLVILVIFSIGGAVAIAPITGIIAVAVSVFAGSWSARIHARQATSLRAAKGAQFAETLGALTIVKASGAEHKLLSKFETLANIGGLKSHLARQRGRFAGQTANVLVQMTVVATLCLGVMRIDAGVMSIGALAATTILVGRAVMPVSQLVDQFCRIWTLKEVLRGAFSLVEEGEEAGGERDGAESRPFSGAMRLRSVSYYHESTEVTALKNINVEFRPGEKVGLIGRNGGGKTTLLHLLPKLYTPTQGAILIDGFDSRQYSARRLRQEIGFMPQETVLFNASLKDNICLGANDVTEAEFLNAVKISGVFKFAQTHPQGYSMQVGPRGEFLSGGERQAVGLARTLLRDKKVLLLDEPTSMMDHTTEAHVIEHLQAHAEDRTLIISTHRLRLLDLVDRVILLEDGVIIADGPKAAILAKLNANTSANNVIRQAGYAAKSA